MIVDPQDKRIVKWAVDRCSPWYYTKEEGLPDPCLKVHCGYVTAYFTKGRLQRILTHADRKGMDDMFAELMQVFALCAEPDYSFKTSFLEDFGHTTTYDSTIGSRDTEPPFRQC